MALLEGYYYCAKEIHGDPSKPLLIQMMSRRMLRKMDADSQLDYYRRLEPSTPSHHFFVYFREEPMDAVHVQLLEEFHDNNGEAYRSRRESE